MQVKTLLEPCVCRGNVGSRDGGFLNVRSTALQALVAWRLDAFPYDRPNIIGQASGSETERLSERSGDPVSMW